MNEITNSKIIELFAEFSDYKPPTWLIEVIKKIIIKLNTKKDV